MDISRRTFLTGLAATSLVVVGGYTATRRRGPLEGATEMTPPELLDAAREGSVLLIDIRRPDEWEKTGLAEGAVPIDMRRTDFVDAVRTVRGADPKPIALICARGVRSRRMARAMLDAGMTPIVDVPEGMLGSSAGPGWLERSLPVEKWTG